ncbi:MAG: M56 family metallopeptidase [Lachnospiraceae bacterium]|jgi:beta-lactamase regulating signal transducer with metallopeptidase domain|nr:M56 family metallopeptidase [Lachnospiraceae bacterium]
MPIVEISVYSFVSAILFFSIGLVIIRKLRSDTIFLVKNSTTDLIILFMLSICRILLPLDLSYAFIISSESVLPFIERTLNHDIWKHTTIGMILIGVWITGALGVIAKEIWDVVREIKVIRGYRIVQSEQVERIVSKSFANKNINVVVSPEVDVPKAIGFRKAFIYLPVISVTDQEMEFILRHEVQHIKGGDIFVKIFYLLLKAVFWWNPIVYIFQKEVEHLLELKCDMSVTKNMKMEERLTYLETILNVMKQVSLEYKDTSCSLSQLLNGDLQGIMKQRFEVILNKPVENRKKNRVCSKFIIIIAFLCSYLIIIQPAYDPPAEDIVESVTITEDNAYIVIDEEGVIQIFVNNKPFMILSNKDLNMEPFNKLPIKQEEIEKNEANT